MSLLMRRGGCLLRGSLLLLGLDLMGGRWIGRLWCFLEFGSRELWRDGYLCGIAKERLTDLLSMSFICMHLCSMRLSIMPLSELCHASSKECPRNHAINFTSSSLLDLVRLFVGLVILSLARRGPTCHEFIQLYSALRHLVLLRLLSFVTLCLQVTRRGSTSLRSFPLRKLIKSASETQTLHTRL